MGITGCISAANVVAIIASSLAILLVYGSLSHNFFISSQAIPPPAFKGNTTSESSPANDQVLLHLKNAEDSVKNANNTNAIIEIIKAVRVQHDLVKTTGAAAGLENQTISKRNMGAMSNETTGLNLTSAFK